MATILRSLKYINFFTGHHLRTHQSNYSPLSKHVLESHYATLHTNGNTQTPIVKLEFLPEKLPPPIIILENIRERYFQSKSSSQVELDMLLKSMHNNSSSVAPNIGTGLILANDIEMLIHCCGSTMKSEMPNVRLQIVDNLWQMFKTLDSTLNISHYNALLNVYLENEKDFSPANMLLEMNNNNIQPNELTYQYFLTHYCLKGNIEEANKILSFLKESEITVNENIFNALIIGNAEANDMNGALNILNIMREIGCIPSSKTYAALLEAYARKGDIASIMTTLKRCESKNMIILDKYKMNIIYHLAINGYADQVDKILPTFVWDASFAHENKNFFSKLMYHKQVDVAVQVLLAAKSAGVPENSLLASAQAFTRNIIARNLPVGEVIDTFNLLEREGFVIYEDAVHQCFCEKVANYCIPLLRAWRKTDFKMKEHFFWPILAMHGDKNVDKVFETLRLMKDEFGITPSNVTLTRFVLPYVQQCNSRDVMNRLINDAGIPPESAVNTILCHDLYKTKIKSAAECVKESAGYNISYNKETLLPLLEKAVGLTNNVEAYNFIKTQLEKMKDTRDSQGFRGRRDNSRFYLLPTLNTINLGFKLKNCAEKGDLVAAGKCVEELRRYRQCKLSIDKLFSYIDLLVKNDKVKDALQVLQDFSAGEMHLVRFNKKTFQQCSTSLDLLAEKGSVSGVNQMFEFLRKNRVNVTMTMAYSLVKVHLVRNDSKQALEAVKKIHKDFYIIPLKIKLMKTLIEGSEVESLQWLTDFSTQHQGERLTLLPLAIAFLKCQRSRQARRILESASSPMRDDSLRSCVNQLFAEEDISTVKGLIQVTKGLTSINRQVLFEMLLEKNSVTNNWEEGLELWKEMQEENVRPSELFMMILTELLKRNDQSLPYQVPQSSLDVEESDNCYTKIIKMYIEKKALPGREFFIELVENLIEAGDTKTIELIQDQWANIYDGYLRNNPIRFKAWIKANSVDNYLEHIKTMLETGKEEDVKELIMSVDHTLLKNFLEHPEINDKYEPLALSIYSEHRLYKPLLLTIAYHFLKNETRAKELWAATGKNIHQSNISYIFLVHAYVNAGFFDQLPQLAKTLHECPNINRRMFYEVFLEAYEEQNKYEEGLLVLSKFGPPTNSYRKIQNIEENSNPELEKSQAVL